MAISTFMRKEIKYLLTLEQKEKLLPYLENYMRYDNYCQNGNKYIVNNIYFDTDTYNVVRHSISHPTYKEKVRLRTYIVNAKDDDVCFLEIKKKFSGVVNKRRITMTLSDATNYIEKGIKTFPNTYVNNQVANELDYIFNNTNLHEAVYLSYVRTALFSKDDPSLRLTIDEDIITREHDLSLQQERYGDSLLEPDTYLMEIKVSNAMPLWLTNKLSELNIFPTSFSKYGKYYQTMKKEN